MMIPPPQTIIVVNTLTPVKPSVFLHQQHIIHYQKIDKYKRKYRGNISVGKFPSVYTEGITVGKKIKTKQKKMMTCHFYQRNYRR